MFSNNIENTFFKAAVHQCNDLVAITDASANIVYVNPAFEKHTGYKLKAIKGQNISILKSGMHTAVFYKNLWESISRGKTRSAVFINKKKNGELYYENKTITPVKNEAGDILYYLSTAKDFTSEIRLKQEIITQKGFIESVIQKTDALIVGVNEDSSISVFNKASEDLSGYKYSEVNGLDVFNLLMSEKDERKSRAVFNDILSGKHKARKLESKWISRSGEEYIIRWSYSKIGGAANKLPMLLFTGVNVTDEKQQKQKLLKVNARLGDKVKKGTKEIELLNEKISLTGQFISKVNADLPALVYLADLKTNKIQLLNRHVSESIEFPQPAENQENFHDFFTYFKDLSGKKPTKNSFLFDSPDKEYTLLLNGRNYEVQNKTIVFKRDKAGQPKIMLGFVTDVSKAKIIKKRFEDSQRIALIGFWEWNLVNNEIYWSDEIYRMMELDPEIYKPSYDSFVLLVHPDDLEKMQQSIDDALAGRKKYNIIFRLITGSGKIKFIVEQGQVDFDKHNTPVKMTGLIRDVTETEYMKKRLEESQELAKIGTFEYDLVNNEIFWSKELYRISGYMNDTPVTNELVDRIVHPEDKYFVFKIPVDALEKKENYVMEYRIITPDGRMKYVCTKGYAEYDSKGVPIRLLGATQDITDEKILKNKLLSSFVTLENSYNAIATVGLTGHIEYANPSALKMWGYKTLEQLIAERPTVFDYWVPEERNVIYDYLEVVIQSGFYSNDEPLRGVTHDGRVLLIKFSATLIRDAHGNPAAVTVSFLDITEQIKVDKLLVENEKKFRCLYENALVGIYRSNAETGQPIEINDACVNLFGYDSREDFMSNFLFSENYVNWKDRDELLGMLKQYKQVQDQQILFKKKDGSVFWGNVSINFIEEEGVIEGVVVDTTQTKIYEEELEKSIIEKSLLLKEIHHRVKNNLQIISSLLNLQLKKLSDPSLMEPLFESRERIRVIALIHEKLYLSEDIATINFSDYLQDLTRPMSLLNREQKIKVTFSMSEFNTNIDRAIPLALTCHEIISNAFKHAFKINKAGHLNIALNRYEAGHQIVISDTGDGFSTADAGRGKSLGWSLIHSLAKQAKASVSVVSAPGKGSEFKILL